MFAYAVENGSNYIKKSRLQPQKYHIRRSEHKWIFRMIVKKNFHFHFEQKRALVVLSYINSNKS